MTNGYVIKNEFANARKKKKEIQKIWNGFTINNSWQHFVINMPHSISALERLMMESLKPTFLSSFTDTPSTGSVRKREISGCTQNDLTVRSADYIMEHKTSQLKPLKPYLVEILNETKNVFGKTVDAMIAVGENVEKIPQKVEAVLDELNEPKIEKLEKVLTRKFREIHKLIDNTARAAFSLETVFSKLFKLCEGKNAKVDRTGFMLLNEIKHLFDRISAFFLEVSKLIEFALDITCNRLIEQVGVQVDLMLTNPKYVPKAKSSKELYRTSLSIAVYSLILRQIAQYYVQFTNNFIIPQIDVIFQYSFVSNSEIELKKTREQFQKLNMACRKEIEHMTDTNRLETKRASVLQIDLGLNLHMSDIASEINASLFSIAAFPERQSPKQSKVHHSDNVKSRMNEFLSHVRGRFAYTSKYRRETL